MGSIPLPALDIKTPQQPDLLEKYGQLQALKNQQVQSQLAQQEAPLRLQQLQQGVQSGGLQIQQQQQDAAARQALNQAYAGAVTPDASGKPTFDPDKLMQGLKNGPAAYQIPSVMKNIVEFQKTNVDLQTAKTDLQGKQNDLIGHAAAAVKAAGYDPTLAHSLFDSLPQSPQLQQLRQQIDNPQSLKQLVDSAIQNSPKEREIGAQELTAQSRDTAAQNQQNNLANTEAHQSVQERQNAQRISIEGARLAFDRQRQGTQDDAAVEAQAQQIANGDVKALSLARNNPYAKAVMARVYDINPKYTDSLYTATQDLRSSKPNSMGANVGRLGTAILHADNALGNSNNLGFSEGLLTGVGTQGTAAYKQDAEFLTGEIGQFVTGGKLTVDEGNKISKDLMSSRQGVRDSAIHQIIDLSGGKLKSQMEQFKNATQTDFPTDRVFNDPTIKASLQKHGVIGQTAPQGQSGPPAGATHTVPGSDGKMHYTDGKTDLGVVQ